MSEEVNCDLTAGNIQPWKYKEFEKGINVASGSCELLSDSAGGTVTAHYRINPDTRVNFQPYVAVTRIAVKTSVVACIGNATVLAIGGQFDRAPDPDGGGGAPLMLSPIPMIQGESTIIFSGGWHGFVNLGRSAPGVYGKLDIVLNEGAGLMLTAFTAEFLISDHPIAGRWWLSA